MDETNSNKLKNGVSIQNKIEYILFILFVKFFNLLGIERARKFSVFLAFIFFYVIPIRKKIVIRNLQTAFPNLNAHEVYTLAYKCYRSITITFVEIFCIPSLTKDKINSLVDIPEVWKIREKYDEKRGGILLTAHMGNWELGAASVGIKLGIPVYLVAKAQRNNFVTEWLNKMRKSAGNEVVMLGVSIKNIFRELLNKNIVGIVGDQRGSSDGQRVNFFNRSTAVYTGAAMLSIKTNAPIFVAMINRQHNYLYKVDLEVIDPLDLNGIEDEKLQFITQKFMNILECYIKQYPEQWFWMHNIWKY